MVPDSNSYDTDWLYGDGDSSSDVDHVSAADEALKASRLSVRDEIASLDTEKKEVLSGIEAQKSIISAQKATLATHLGATDRSSIDDASFLGRLVLISEGHIATASQSLLALESRLKAINERLGALGEGSVVDPDSLPDSQRLVDLKNQREVLALSLEELGAEIASLSSSLKNLELTDFQERAGEWHQEHSAYEASLADCRTKLSCRQKEYENLSILIDDMTC